MKSATETTYRPCLPALFIAILSYSNRCDKRKEMSETRDRDYQDAIIEATANRYNPPSQLYRKTSFSLHVFQSLYQLLLKVKQQCIVKQ